MSAAAFKATYSDLRLIKSRKVVQLVFEIPLEAADEAYSVLGGMPRPDREVWCAIARLQAETTQERDRLAEPSEAQPASVTVPKEPVRASIHAKQAGRLCNEPKFWRFLHEKFNFTPDTNENPSDGAADVVRGYCNVKSRADIKPGTAAEQRWLLLLSSYRAWDNAPSCGIVA